MSNAKNPDLLIFANGFRQFYAGGAAVALAVMAMWLSDAHLIENLHDATDMAG